MSAQNGESWRALIVFTRKVCSSSGFEYMACPSSYAGAFSRLTAGRFPAPRALKKSLRSYWWFAWSDWPITETEPGARW